jgi:RNA polymerase sigma-70 factor (ECF subfamily)
MPDILETIALNHSKSLIDKAKTGDQQAFSKLVGLWFKRIYNFSYKYMGEHDVAMEVTQKTFIAVYDHLISLRKVESFRFWIYRIALNQCREEDRKISKKNWLSIFHNEEAHQVSDDVFHPEKSYEQMEKEELMGALLNKLPEDQRVIIIMKEYEGLKFREIADALEISENTAKSRLYYGLKGLRQMIEKNNLKLKLIE